MLRPLLALGSSFLTGGVRVGGPAASFAVMGVMAAPEGGLRWLAIWGDRVGGPGETSGELVLVDIT